MNLNNILKSGYGFGDEEYELELKYVLFNSLLIFNVFMVSIATIVRFSNHQYSHALFDFIYVVFGLITILIARKSKLYFDYLLYFVIFFSFSIVVLVFSTGLNHIAGISWYFILLMSTFYLKGKREGIIIFILSFISIFILLSAQNSYSSTDIVLGIIPFFAALIFMCFVEQRNNNLKRLLEMQKENYLHQAQYDNLTGVANRGLFIDRLTHSLELAKRLQTKIAVIFIDLDHFKDINDSFGHHAGDMVLIEVAQRLQAHIRKADTIARLGGDEYAIILDNFDSLASLENIIQKLLRSMDKPFIIEESRLDVTLSLGVTIYPNDADKTDLLLRNADAAMYKAKAEGKNAYSFYNKSL